jgi:hypothetical protein
MLCEQRLQSFVQKRGIGIWDYRLLDEEPIPGSLRFQVLKAAGGRCQLCGYRPRRESRRQIANSWPLLVGQGCAVGSQGQGIGIAIQIRSVEGNCRQGKMTGP